MLQGGIEIFGQTLRSTDSVQQHLVGTLAHTKDGRLFRYSRGGSSDLTAGYLQLGPARKTNHDNVAASEAAAVDATSVSVTLGATAATADEYAEGLLIPSDVAPEGIAGFMISDHPAASASADLALKLAESLTEAVTTSSEFCLMHNRFQNTVEGTVQAAGIVAGVAPVDVDVSEARFFWAQTYGIAGVLADEDGTVNRAVTVGSSTSGAVEERDDMLQSTDASRFLLEPTVGYQVVAMVDTEFRPIFLTLES